MQVLNRIAVTVMHANPVIAAGLAVAYAQDGEFELQSTDAAAVTRTPPSRLDRQVVVADFDTGLRLIEQARPSSPPRILLVASVYRAQRVRQALQAGVYGYVSAQTGLAELVQAVRCVHQGRRYLCSAAARCMAESFAVQALTPREEDVLALLGEGLDNKTISRRLDIALGTVKVHVKALLDKLQASSRTEAVVLALRHGLLVQDRMNA